MRAWWTIHGGTGLMRKVRLAGVWIVLFGVTLAVRLACTASPPSSSAAATIANDDAINKELDVVLRRAGVNFQDTSPEVDARIAEYLGKNSDGLRRCRQRVMRRSKRPVEYFEISFNLEILSSSTERSPSLISTNAGGIVRARVEIEHALVERSTIPLTSEDRDCIASEFSKISFESKGAPGPTTPTSPTSLEGIRAHFLGDTADNEGVRTVYQLCFRALKQQEI